LRKVKCYFKVESLIQAKLRPHFCLKYTQYGKILVVEKIFAFENRPLGLNGLNELQVMICIVVSYSKSSAIILNVAIIFR